MTKRILLAFFSIMLIPNAFSQTGIDVASMNGADNLIKSFMTKWSIGGGAVAITKDGKLIYNRGFGFSDQAKTQLAQPNNLFRIASISKQITAIAIMKLIENGKLGINDTVFGANKILNQAYYLSSISDNRIYKITIKNLLEHNAGWDRSIACDGFTHCDPISFPLHVTTVLGASNPVGDSSLIKFLLAKSLNYTPGSTYAYSNIGYLILGKVIEKITGMNYEDYVQQAIFQPLGLCDIHLGKNLLVDKQEREVEYNSNFTTLSCYGTGQTVKWQYGGWNLEAMNAHGGWIATASDLTKLILAVDKYTTFPDILNATSITTMTTGSTPNPNYALGWEVNSFGNWWHTGSLDGTSAFIARTSGGYTWAFLFNARSGSNSFWAELDDLPWDCIASVSSFPSHNLYPPTGYVSSLNAVVVNQSSANISWTNGSGDGRIVVATEASSMSNFPADGTSYSASAACGSGTDIGNNNYVVYNGTGNNFTLTNLNPAKTYLITAYEFNHNAGTGNFRIFKNGCRSMAIVNTGSNGLNSSLHGSTLRVNPNPSNKEIEIVSGFNLQNAAIKLISVTGEVLMEQKDVMGTSLKWDIGKFANGIYFLEVYDEGNTYRIKMLKN